MITMSETSLTTECTTDFVVSYVSSVLMHAQRRVSKKFHQGNENGLRENLNEITVSSAQQGNRALSLRLVLALTLRSLRNRCRITEQAQDNR